VSTTPNHKAFASSLFQAGRFVLAYGGPTGFARGYVTSWDTWEEAAAAFPIERGHYLEDGETGRVWRSGYAYEWEAGLPAAR
jgi:hypothetical protein